MRTSKILRTIGFAVAFAGVLALLGFVGSIRSSASCDRVLIHIVPPVENLVREADVRTLVNTHFGVLVGEPLNQINTKKIENVLKEMPHVKDIRVYETIDKKLIIDLHERIPLVRLFDREGRTAIMDTDGNLMPLSENAILRIPIISGNFLMDRSMNLTDSTISQSAIDSTLDAIFEYASATTSSPFWRAQIQQTKINSIGDFVAYPRVGNHSINFGKADEMEVKLNRLRIFYHKGLDKSGWNRYSKINLKFKDQIVCTKK